MFSELAKYYLVEWAFSACRWNSCGWKSWRENNRRQNRWMKYFRFLPFFAFFSVFTDYWSEKKNENRRENRSVNWVLLSRRNKVIKTKQIAKCQRNRKKMSKWKNCDPVFVHHWFLFVYEHKKNHFSRFLLCLVLLQRVLCRPTVFSMGILIWHTKANFSFFPRRKRRRKTMDVCRSLLCNVLKRVMRRYFSRQTMRMKSQEVLVRLLKVLSLNFHVCERYLDRLRE